MSKAFFKPNVAPELCHRIALNKSLSVEVWLTTCIVTNFGGHAKCDVLLNPSNPQLSGVKNFPYFPRGGPVPREKPVSMHKDWQPLGFVSQWGGMSVGTGMLYPVSIVDGLVHLHGGLKLVAECKWKQAMASNGDACPVGSAVMTTSGGLHEHFDAIVHTSPPFYNFHDDPDLSLSLCYRAAFETAFAKYSRVATPLLGAGARGFPEDVAIRIAAQECRRWSTKQVTTDAKNNQVVAFGLLERRLVDELADAIQTDENPKKKRADYTVVV